MKTSPFISLVLGLLVCAYATAQSESPLTITPSGYYLTVIDESGSPSYLQLTNIIDLSGNTLPAPDQPEQPKVDPELVAKVKSWADSVNDTQSSQAISAVYAHIRGALGDGTLTPETVWGPLKQATDSALGVVSGGGNWADFRSKLTKEFTDAKQRGKLDTVVQIKIILLSVQHGIELSADGSTAISMDQLVEIARRTNLAIDGVTQ